MYLKTVMVEYNFIRLKLLKLNNSCPYFQDKSLSCNGNEF